MHRSTALWAAGFRPLFAGTLLAAVLLPALWSAFLLGALPLPASLATPPLVWHAHEMLFGFGGALLGGFLLTASKNWVGIRGIHGRPLVLLAAAWLLQRILMAGGSGLSAPVLMLTGSLYTAGMVAWVLATLWRHRRSDTYGPDNRYFLAALPWLVPAQWLVLSADGYAAGVSVAAGIFRLAMLIMLERTLTQFMRAAFGIALLRHAVLDHLIKGLALLLVAGHWLPPGVHASLMLALAAATSVRWLRWHPQRAMTRLDIGIMFLAQLGLIAELLLAAAPAVGILLPATAGLHSLTVGGLGLLAVAMIIRISRGHTGRPVGFDRLDRAALWLVVAAALLRVAGPALSPGHTAAWIGLSAAAWTAAFLPLALRFIPLYLQPRADGREG